MRTLLQTLTCICLFAWSSSLLAQADCTLNAAYFCDDFEAYDESMPLGPQSAEWTTWSGNEGGAEDGDVSTTQSASGTQSLGIIGQAGGGPQDVLLLLGNQTSGRYRLQFKMYIPEGFGAYYNIQKTETPAEEFAFQIDFTPSGTAIMDAGNGADAEASYPHDQWIVIDHIIDLDNDWATLSIDGRPFHSWPYSNMAFGTGGLLSIGGIDFFPLDASYQYFIDDVFIEAQPACSIDYESIICDDMEGYPGAPVIGPESSFWTTWSGSEGGVDDGTLSTAQANSGTTSIEIAEGQTQDILLLLGNKREGAYTLEWMQYIPADKTGYFNLQEDEEPGVQWNLEIFFNETGAAPGTGSIVNTGGTFSYPEGAWFKVRHFIDLDADALVLYVDDQLVLNDFPYVDQSIGGANFFSIDADNLYYIDDVLFKEGVDCAEIDPITATGNATASDGSDNGTATVEVSGGLGAYSYEWSNGATTASISDLAPGDYTCTVSPASNVGGCIDEVTVTVTVEGPSSTFSTEVLKKLLIAPNPTTGYTTLQVELQEAAEVTLDIRNLAGQQILTPRTQFGNQPSFEINLQDQASGVYFARLTIGDQVIVRRIIRQ